MTIDELLEELDNAKDAMGGATEIRIAYQPRWPLRGKIANVCIPDPPEDGPHCDEHICYVKSCHDCNSEVEAWEEAGRPEPDARNNENEVLWIAVGDGIGYDENPYAPRWAWGY
jgi:hypothetical protein